MANVVKNLPTNAGNSREIGSIPGSGRSGEENGNPLQYSCLENPIRQRSLADYSPWGWEESDTTERLHCLFKYIRIFVHIEVQESHWNIHSGCLKIESSKFLFFSS